MISDSDSWKFDFKCHLKATEVDQLSDLFVLIGSTPPSLDNLVDTRRWNDCSGIVTVKSLYLKLTVVEGVENFPRSFIWKPAIPPKISFLLWSLVYNKLNTIDILDRKGIHITLVLRVRTWKSRRIIFSYTVRLPARFGAC